MADVKKEHELTVTVSPHVRDEETTSRIMWTVNLSLLPAFFMGFLFLRLKGSLYYCLMHNIISPFRVFLSESR